LGGSEITVFLASLAAFVASFVYDYVLTDGGAGLTQAMQIVQGA
jgi:hypothetical protein